jgi:hypothetical protein
VFIEDFHGAPAFNHPRTLPNRKHRDLSANDRQAQPLEANAVGFSGQKNAPELAWQLSKRMNSCTKGWNWERVLELDLSGVV